MLRFSDLPPALRTLLLAVQPDLPPAHRHSLQLLAKELTAADWESFLQLAVHHRLDSLAWHALQLLQLTPPPHEVATTLRRRAGQNAFAALRAASEAERVSRHFAEAGLPTTSLKGITLSELLYGNPNARHCGDLDLLSTPEQLARQIELLADCGYTLTNPAARLTPSRILSFRRFWKDFTFQNLDAGFELDLHWRLFNNRFHAANRLLENDARIPLLVFGTELDVLTPEDQFLYTAAHGVSDAFLVFKSLSDVAGFLCMFNPQQLHSALLRARQVGLLAQVSAAIHLSNDWMLTEAASPALLPASDRLHVSLRRRVDALMLRQDFLPQRSFFSPAQWLGLELELVPGFRSFKEVALRFLWRPRVWARADLPDAFFPLYALLGLMLPPRRHKPLAGYTLAGQSQAAPRTPLESPKAAGSSGVSNSPPNT